MTSAYYKFPIGSDKVLAFPLLQSDGNPNDFTGATGQLLLRYQDGTKIVRALTWSSAMQEWEYAVVGSEFAVGRWWAEAAISWPGDTQPTMSTEVIFDVTAAD